MSQEKLRMARIHSRKCVELDLELQTLNLSNVDRCPSHIQLDLIFKHCFHFWREKVKN